MMPPTELRPATPVLEIGGTHVTAALVDHAAARLRAGTVRRETLTSDEPAHDVVGTLIRCANTLNAPAGARWAIALPGPFDYEKGVALFTGVGKFDALHGLDVRRALMEGLSPRPSQISFLNDAHAFTLGEWAVGAAAGHTRVVGITLGTGVGSAFLDAGSLVTRGPDVPPQGHAHLLTAHGRPLEDTVSRRALLARYADVTGDRHGARTDVADIAARARAGDRAARAVFDEVFSTLGRTLRPWLERFAATVVVVGGSITQSWDLVGEPLRRGLEPDRSHRGVAPHVVPARRLHDAALVGAARYAREVPPGTGAADGSGARTAAGGGMT